MPDTRSAVVAADLAAEQALGQLGLGLAGLRRVGEDPTQRHLAVEQRGDGGQLVGELRRVDGRVVRQRVETLTCGGQCLAARSVHRAASAFSSSSSRKRSIGAALPGVVLEGLADELAGQVGGELAHVLAQRGRGGLAVGLDLGVTGGDDLLALPLAFRAHLRDERGALLLRLLAQARGLVAGLGELSLVLLKNALGLGLGGLGLLDTAFDGLATLVQNLVDVREELLGEEAEDDDEGDQADDELGDRRDERVLRLLGRQRPGRSHQCLSSECGSSGSRRSVTVDERHDETDQGERLTEGEAEDLVGADQAGGLGLAGQGLGAVTEDDADADAGADGGEAVTDGAEVSR